MSRKKGTESRNDMMKVARRLLSRSGYDEVSFQRIAEECGLSQSAVLHHFANKSALLEALVEQAIAHNHQMVIESQEPRDSAVTRLRKHIRENIRWVTEYREEASLLLLLFYVASIDNGMRAILKRTLERGRGRIEELVLASEREGDLRVTQDVGLYGT